MKRFTFLLVTVLFFHSVPAQDKKLVSLRGGTLASATNSGVGFQAAYAIEIQERFFFSTSVGYFTFDDNHRLNVNNTGYQPPQRIINEAFPFTFGVKYFFSKEKFNPYLSFFWGMLKRNANVYSIVDANEISSRTIKSIHDTQLTANIGFEFGTLFYLTENLAADINVNASHGTIQTIMLVGGFTYVL
ncbi:MAG: hypothetical protein FD122_702 [Stygiobacter sp.]|nr:MAG: hypothetical protein FD122_702 [Stygiobacter sp.]KAF0216418.1 MAG: hypothetical protein FD178_1119 [Ignavibacteria bacterium]